MASHLPLAIVYVNDVSRLSCDKNDHNNDDVIVDDQDDDDDDDTGDFLGRRCPGTVPRWITKGFAV